MRTRHDRQTTPSQLSALLRSLVAQRPPFAQAPGAHPSPGCSGSGDADLVDQEGLAGSEVPGHRLDGEPAAGLDLVDHGDLVPAGVDQGDADHVGAVPVRTELAPEWPTATRST